MTSDFALDEHETTLLRQACRIADRLDDLDEITARDGIMRTSSQGERVHPALVESRQQALALAKVLGALAVPSGVADDEGDEPVRRSAGRRSVARAGLRAVGR